MCVLLCSKLTAGRNNIVRISYNVLEPMFPEDMRYFKSLFQRINFLIIIFFSLSPSLFRANCFRYFTYASLKFFKKSTTVIRPGLKIFFANFQISNKRAFNYFFRAIHFINRTIIRCIEIDFYMTVYGLL